jgi:osmotically-inducible protein OsmY
MPHDDDNLREKIEARLREDRRIDASGIRVAVKRGRVTLTGTVDTYQASALAQAAADGAAGGGRIDNRIRVRFPGRIAPPTDEAIRVRIQVALSLQRDLALDDLILEVADGIVFIDGFVPSREARSRIRRIATRERGVVEVRDRLAVIPADPGRHTNA